MAQVRMHVGKLRDRVVVERRRRTRNTDGSVEWDDGEELLWDGGDQVLFDDGGESLGDGAGNYELEWVELIPSRSAFIQARRGGEAVIAGRLAAVKAYDIWMLCDPMTSRIREGDRLIDARDGSRIFAIRFAEPIDDERRWMFIQAEEGVAD